MQELKKKPLKKHLMLAIKSHVMVLLTIMHRRTIYPLLNREIETGMSYELSLLSSTAV